MTVKFSEVSDPTAFPIAEILATAADLDPFIGLPARYGNVLAVKKNSDPPCVLTESGAVKLWQGRFKRCRTKNWAGKPFKAPRGEEKVGDITVAGWNGMSNREWKRRQRA